MSLAPTQQLPWPGVVSAGEDSTSDQHSAIRLPSLSELLSGTPPTHTLRSTYSAGTLSPNPAAPAATAGIPFAVPRPPHSGSTTHGHAITAASPTVAAVIVPTDAAATSGGIVSNDREISPDMSSVPLATWARSHHMVTSPTIAMAGSSVAGYPASSAIPIRSAFRNSTGHQGNNKTGADADDDDDDDEEEEVSLAAAAAGLGIMLGTHPTCIDQPPLAQSVPANFGSSHSRHTSNSSSSNSGSFRGAALPTGAPTPPNSFSKRKRPSPNALNLPATAEDSSARAMANIAATISPTSGHSILGKDELQRSSSSSSSSAGLVHAWIGSPGQSPHALLYPRAPPLSPMSQLASPDLTGPSALSTLAMQHATAVERSSKKTRHYPHGAVPGGHPTAPPSPPHAAELTRRANPASIATVAPLCSPTWPSQRTAPAPPVPAPAAHPSRHHASHPVPYQRPHHRRELSASTCMATLTLDDDMPLVSARTNATVNYSALASTVSSLPSTAPFSASSSSPSALVSVKPTTIVATSAASPSSITTASSAPSMAISPSDFFPFSDTTTKFMCPDCGKQYKHPICLGKHRWEHHEHWPSVTRLLLTKHQQVQLMEAAQILVDIGGDAPDTPSPPHLSASPTAL